MEITSTTVTKTAVQKTDSVVYLVEHIEQDGKFSRIHCNIHSRDSQTGDSGDYLGSVYLENNNLSCSIAYDENTIAHINAVVGIIESVRIEESPDDSNETKQK